MCVCFGERRAMEIVGERVFNIFKPLTIMYSDDRTLPRERFRTRYTYFTSTSSAQKIRTDRPTDLYKYSLRVSVTRDVLTTTAEQQ